MNRFLAFVFHPLNQRDKVTVHPTWWSHHLLILTDWGTMHTSQWPPPLPRIPSLSSTWTRVIDSSWDMSGRLLIVTKDREENQSVRDSQLHWLLAVRQWETHAHSNECPNVLFSPTLSKGSVIHFSEIVI